MTVQMQSEQFAVSQKCNTPDGCLAAEPGFEAEPHHNDVLHWAGLLCMFVHTVDAPGNAPTACRQGGVGLPFFMCVENLLSLLHIQHVCHILKSQSLAPFIRLGALTSHRKSLILVA